MQPQRAPANQPRLKDITFGFASADFEAAHEPDLLLRGFVDHMNLVENARSSRKFLFLGYKGSGKSALGEHLKLVAQTEPELFVEFVNIDDISFSSFSQILQRSIEPEARYPKVWSWLLLLFLFNSFSKDEGSNFAQDEELFLTTEGLKQLGLLPQPTLSNAIATTSEQSFSLKLSTVLGGIETTFKTTKAGADLPFFIERLKRSARRFRTSSRHLLIIDGFDELLRRGNLQYDALGALIFEANKLNLDFASTCNSVKIIVLCRTDLFERLPGPNKNKIRQNCAVHLDWCNDPEQPERSSLIDLINHRARLSVGADIDVFDMFLPDTLDVHQESATRRQLLEHTRHLPRDMVNLFRKLQEYSGDGRMTRGQVWSALSAYSRDYFLPEITDEMDGYIDGENIDLAKRLLGSFRRVQFTIAELSAHAATLCYPGSFELLKILDVLFRCSAIGNVARTAEGERFVFKYRNQYAGLNRQQPIRVHRGLWQGLNLISP
jgi:hypothetical protein